jgi:HlyD family secretion protein
MQKIINSIATWMKPLRSAFTQHTWVRRVIYVVVVLIFLAVGWRLLAGALGWNDPQYKTVAVEEGPLLVTISASGTLNPVKSVQVGTQVSGMLQEIYVDFNDVVKKGQVIARIDAREWQARFEQAEANYILANRNHENNKRLLEKNFISQAAVDQTLSAYRSAKAAMAMAKKALDDTVIRAPVDGVVVKRSVERGQTVAASLQAPELFIIAQDLSDMQVETAIDESDVGRITEGMTASFTVDAFPGRVFQSKVKQVRKAPVNIQNVVTYTVLLTAENPDLKLLPGMTANASIITEQKEKVLRVSNAALRFKMPEMIAGIESGKAADKSANVSVPGSAAGSTNKSEGSKDRPAKGMREGGKPYSGAQRPTTRKVWVLEDGGLKPKPVQKTIRVGMSDGGATEVLADQEGNYGLKVGDQVIVGSSTKAGGSSATPKVTGPRLF